MLTVEAFQLQTAPPPHAFIRSKAAGSHMGDSLPGCHAPYEAPQLVQTRNPKKDTHTTHTRDFSFPPKPSHGDSAQPVVAFQHPFWRGAHAIRSYRRSLHSPTPRTIEIDAEEAARAMRSPTLRPGLRADGNRLNDESISPKTRSVSIKDQHGCHNRPFLTEDNAATALHDGSSSVLILKDSLRTKLNQVAPPRLAL